MLALANIHNTKTNFDTLVKLVLNNQNLQELFNEWMSQHECVPLDFASGAINIDIIKATGVSFD